MENPRISLTYLNNKLNDLIKRFDDLPLELQKDIDDKVVILISKLSEIKNEVDIVKQEIEIMIG